MPEVLKELVWGVEVGGLFLAMIRMFKPYLEKVEYLGVNGTGWAIAVAAATMSGLVVYADVIATQLPVMVDVVGVAGVVLIPFFVALGFWGDVTNLANKVMVKLTGDKTN